MYTGIKRVLLASLLTAAACFSVPVSAQTAGANMYREQVDEEQIRREPTGAEMLFDATIVRPMGLVGTVVGAAAWVVSLPFTLPSHSTERAAKQLVAKPAEFTFKRPLGQFSSCEGLPESCGRGR
jgi:hypothetical protein